MIGGKESPMRTIEGHSWFLIVCSWEWEADSVAMDKWVDVYNYFKRIPMPSGEVTARDDIADQGLTALNLIGERQFMIAGQTKSNRPLQEISSMVTLNTPITVEVFAATNVFDFGEINKQRIKFNEESDGRLKVNQ